MAMTKGEIDGLVEALLAQHARVGDGGLDDIDLHASSGYLIDEFYRPRSTSVPKNMARPASNIKD